MISSVSRFDRTVSGTGTGTDPGSAARDAATAGHTPSDTSEADSYSLSPTDSPCVAVCSTLYDDICRGCGRTAIEVANWVFMSDEEKKAVWVRICAQGYPRRKLP